MVKAAYGSGKPAYGVGAGNATMVIDETADVAEAARNTRISKTNDHGSGCSADGNLLVDASDLRRVPRRSCRPRAAIWSTERGEGRCCEAAYWDADGHRTADTIARAGVGGRASAPASRSPTTRRSSIVAEQHIGKQHRFSTEKLGTVLAIFKYDGFDHGARHGAADLRDRRQGPLLRHLLVRRRPHPSAGAGRAGQPDHGPPGAVERRTPARSPTACR